MNSIERRSVRGETAIENLLLAACQAFHLRNVGILRGRSRVHVISQARCYVAAVLRGEEFKLSLPEIGKVLGGRDHSTISYYLKRRDQLHDDAWFHRCSGSAELIRMNLGKDPNGRVKDPAVPLDADGEKSPGPPDEVDEPGEGIS
jgi:hypothetical protein